jgi:hypothetical protein
MEKNNKVMLEKIHGYYTYSNCCGYGVILSDCGEAAKLVMDSDGHNITDWLDIEYVFDEDVNDFVPTIDPNGFNVPLNLVVRAY